MSRESKLQDLVAQAESSVVNLCLTSPSTIDTMRPYVTPASFRDTGLGEMYRVLVAMRDGGLAISRRSFVVAMQQADASFSHMELDRIIANPEFDLNAEMYARIVAENHVRRRVYGRLRKILQSEYAPDVDLEAMRAEVLAEFEGLVTVDARPKTLRECVAESKRQKLEALREGRPLGWSTGFREWDRISSGFHPGDLILIGGRTGAGKTVMLLQLANTLDRAGLKVWIASLEMTQTILADRAISSTLDIDYRAFSEHGALSEADLEAIPDEVFSERMIITEDNESIDTLIAKARLYRPDVVFIDYIGLVEPDSRKLKKHEQLNRISERLKATARELKCAIIVAAQLNADAEGRQPTVTDFSEARQLPKDTDITALLWATEESKYTVLLPKNRRGPRNLSFDLTFEGQYQRFVQPELVEMPL